MKSRSFWLVVTVDEAGFLDRLLATPKASTSAEHLADIARLVERFPELLERVPAELRSRIV